MHRERKAYEIERNESGGNARTAEETLRAKRITNKETLATYKAGKIPDGRIHLRAMRWTVKLFLSHYHAVGYELEHGCAPPKPYVISHGGHSHCIAPPKWPM